MQVIENGKELLGVKDNTFLGCLPKMNNSRIVFYGHDNILLCDDSVVLNDSVIVFGASNSVIYLKNSTHKYRLILTVFDNSTVYIDEGNSFNQPLEAVVSEETNLIIGRNNMFSKGISLMTTDHHPIYSIKNLERINKAKSVYIGDHVWVGQNATLLKGTQIDSGSIVGASSLVVGLRIPNNTVVGGNPAKIIKDGVFWDGRCTHKWVTDNPSSNYYDGDFNSFQYFYDNSQMISYDSIDYDLKRSSSKEKIELLSELSLNLDKNRFVHFDRGKVIIKE